MAIRISWTRDIGVQQGLYAGRRTLSTDEQNIACAMRDPGPWQSPKNTALKERWPRGNSAKQYVFPR
ncbi:MAG: hypothetical protein ACKV2V_26120, partial [Blastocatellia bacterium]